MAFDTLKAVMELDQTGVESGLKKMMESIHKVIADPKAGKLDMTKLFDTNFNSINWTSIIGKLFTPANLIAFFSAMAATGIVAGVQAQNAGAAGASAAGLNTGGGNSTSAITSGALTAQNTLGGLAGSTTDVASALGTMTAYVEQFGGTASDATEIITAMGEALQATGGNFGTDFGPLFQLIQNSGATTTSQIEQLISNVMSSSQASGGTLSMADVADQTSDFALAASKAGVSFNAINTAIVTFGSEAKINLSGAQADMSLLTQEVQQTTGGMTALAYQGQSFNGLISSLNSNAAQTFGSMNTALAKMPAPILATLASALGIPTPAAEAAVSLAKWAPAIQASVTALTALSGSQGMATINTQFNDSLTIADKLLIAWQNIKDLFAEIWNASPGAFLIGLAALGALSWAALSALIPKLLTMAGSAIGEGIAGSLGVGGAVAEGAEGVAAVGAAASVPELATAVLAILGALGLAAIVATLPADFAALPSLTDPNSTTQFAPGVPSGFTITNKVSVTSTGGQKAPTAAVAVQNAVNGQALNSGAAGGYSQTNPFLTPGNQM